MPKPLVTEDELINKLKILHANFKQNVAELEKALLAARKDLQTKIDKNKLASVKKYF